MTSSPRFTSLLSLGFSLLLTGASSAASIDWGLGARQITGDSDVDATGTILAAYNFSGTGPVVINGVTFQNVLSPDFENNAPSVTVGAGPGSVTISSSTLYSAEAFQSFGNPYDSLSAPYRALLDSAVWNDSGLDRSITFTITGLTPGQTYRIQLWSNDSREYGEFRSTTYTAGQFVTLDQNTGPAWGGLGEYALGTFVADGTTQTFVGDSAGSTNLNGLVIAAVPEPGITGAAMGLALLAFLARRRSRQA